MSYQQERDVGEGNEEAEESSEYPLSSFVGSSSQQEFVRTVPASATSGGIQDFTSASFQAAGISLQGPNAQHAPEMAPPGIDGPTGHSANAAATMNFLAAQRLADFQGRYDPLSGGLLVADLGLGFNSPYFITAGQLQQAMLSQAALQSRLAAAATMQQNLMLSSPVAGWSLLSPAVGYMGLDPTMLGQQYGIPSSMASAATSAPANANHPISQQMPPSQQQSSTSTTERPPPTVSDASTTSTSNSRMRHPSEEKSNSPKSNHAVRTAQAVSGRMNGEEKSPSSPDKKSKTATTVPSSPAASARPHHESSPHLTGRPPVPIALDCDEQALTEYQCLLRKQIELFEAGPADIRGTAQGRNTPITMGQVGIRCRHCAPITKAARARGAVFYSKTIDGIYQVAQNMSKVHLCERCHRVPDDVKQRLQKLRTANSRASGGKEYWSEGIRALGVYSDGEMLRFAKRLPPPSEDIHVKAGRAKRTSG